MRSSSLRKELERWKTPDIVRNTVKEKCFRSTTCLNEIFIQRIYSKFGKKETGLKKTTFLFNIFDRYQWSSRKGLPTFGSNAWMFDLNTSLFHVNQIPRFLRVEKTNLRSKQVHINPSKSLCAARAVILGRLCFSLLSRDRNFVNEQFQFEK